MNILTGSNPYGRTTYTAQYGGTLAKGGSNQPVALDATDENGALKPQVPTDLSPGNNFLDAVTKGMVTLTAESGAVLQNDPALAVREFATRVHDLASRGYGSADLQAWAPYVGVGARTLIMGANVMRAHHVFTTDGASWLDKGLDSARVATDLLGVAGAVLRATSTTHAALGTTLMGIAQAADLVSHGARFGMHSAPRVKSWLKDHDQKKARQREREKKVSEIQDLALESQLAAARKAAEAAKA